MMRKVLVYIALLQSSVLLANSQGLPKDSSNRIHPQVKYNIPVPPQNRNTLFYIQKSTNPNTVMYEGVRDEYDEINPDKPVHVFWIRYQIDSTQKDLNFIQRKLAYGINFEPAEDKGEYYISLVSYKKRKIHIFKNPAGEIQANMEIDGQMARFRSVFIEIGKDFFIPEISYIEIFGEDLRTGDEIYERIIP